MPDNIAIDDFRGLIGRNVTLKFGHQTQDGTVVEVAKAPGGLDGGRTPFSVVVRSGPVDQHWPQGTYALVHPDHGELPLFMVPIGPDESGMCYEVNFS